MAAQTKTAQYRLRVVQMSDGSIELFFGNDPLPVGGTLLSDHDVTDVTTVTDHVEPS